MALLTIPNTFNAGSTAVAAEVNANFAAIRNVLAGVSSATEVVIARNSATEPPLTLNQIHASGSVLALLNNTTELLRVFSDGLARFGGTLDVQGTGLSLFAGPVDIDDDVTVSGALIVGDSLLVIGDFAVVGSITTLDILQVQGGGTSSFVGPVLFASEGSNQFGPGSAANNVKVRITGTTFTGSGGAPIALHIDAAMQPPANFDSHGILLNPTMTRAASGTHNRITSMRIVPPTLSSGTADVTTAATLMISNQPAEGVNRYALLIEAGLTRFNGPFRVDRVGINADPSANSGTMILTAATNVTALQVNVPGGAALAVFRRTDGSPAGVDIVSAGAMGGIAFYVPGSEASTGWAVGRDGNNNFLVNFGGASLLSTTTRLRVTSAGVLRLTSDSGPELLSDAAVAGHLHVRPPSGNVAGAVKITPSGNSPTSRLFLWGSSDPTETSGGRTLLEHTAAQTDLSVNAASGNTSRIRYILSGTARFLMEPGFLRPAIDNSEKLGDPGSRWSDVQSVLINGADVGFANLWRFREYGATPEDLGYTRAEKGLGGRGGPTKSPQELKEFNDGLMLLDDDNNVVAVFHKDGNVYIQGQIRPLTDLESIDSGKPGGKK